MNTMAAVAFNMILSLFWYTAVFGLI